MFSVFQLEITDESVMYSAELDYEVIYSKNIVGNGILF